MTKNLWLAAAAAVLGVTLWWMFTEPGPRLDQQGDAKGGAGAQSEALLDQPNHADGTDGAEMDAKSTDSSQRIEADDVGGEKALTFRVVMGEESKPVAGAAVFFLQDGDMDREQVQEMGMDRLDPHVMFRTFGQEGLTDENGICQLRWSGKEGAAFSELDEMQSDMGLTGEAEDGVITLKMVEATGVTVRVVDAVGKAVVGAPVSLRVQTEGGGFDGGMEMTLFTRPTEAPDGVIQFSDVSGLMTFDHDPDPDYQVRLEVPGLVLVSEQVKISESRQEVTLVMPAVGGLKIEVVNEAGARVEADGKVELIASGVANHNSGGRFRPDVAIHLEGEITQGVATFPMIGLEKKMRAEVHIPALGMDWKQDIQGPTHAGHVAELQIVAPSTPLIRGRFLLPDGKPAVRRRGLLTLQNLDGRHMENWSFRTDSEGRFLHQVNENYLGKEYLLFLTCHAGLERSYVRAIDGPQLLDKSDLDLGDIHLEQAYRNIKGRCVNPDGVGVGGFRLLAQRADGIGTGVTVNEDGSFQFQATFRSKTTVSADRWQQSDWVLPEPVEVEVDGEEVELIFFPAGSIVGRVEIPEEVFAQSLTVYAVETNPSNAWAPSGAKPSPSKFHGEVTPITGDFVIQGLNRGTYNFELTGPSSTLLAELEGIQVEFGAAASDPRLNPLRYQDSIHQVKLNLVNANGKRVLNAQATYYRKGEYVGSVHDGYGELECEYPYPEQTSLLLTARGYRPQWVDGTLTDQSITMDAGLKIKLQCTAMPDVNQGKETVELMLKWQPDDARMEHLDPVKLPSDFLQKGGSSVSLPGPGIYRLYSREVSKGDGFMSFSDEQPVAGADPISVSEQDQGKTFHISVPKALFN
jgi:hypothetical protein